MKIFLTAIFLFVFAFANFGQSNAEIERDLVSALKELQKHSNYSGAYDDEKLSAAQSAFAEKLLKYAKTPATLGYKFGELAELMQIATSSDGNLRIYSWDLEDGGTMHNYARLYQFKGADGKVYAETDALGEEGDAGSFVTDIFTLDAAPSNKIYIVCATFIGSTQDHGQSASLYKIQGSALNRDVKLIKTRSGLTNSLGFSYNFFSVVDREERPISLISFDNKTKTLKIPVVIEDKEFPNGRVTNRFISYKFNGTHFVKVN